MEVLREHAPLRVSLTVKLTSTGQCPIVGTFLPVLFKKPGTMQSLSSTSPSIRRFPLLLLMMAAFFPTTLLRGADAREAELFPLQQVSLLPGPFLHAQELNLHYVLEHDVDRFVAPYRREAGLPARAEPYPNWESTGLDGHSAGHYLTALAQHAVVSHSEEAAERLAYMVSELKACQEAIGTGYIGGVPGGVEVWEELKAGRLDVDNFSLNGKWVPWYNLHKTFAGLRDAWELTDNEEARLVLERMGEWCLGVLEPLTDEQVQSMLRCEHGGMNEVLADLYVITGDERYLEAAGRFSDRAILRPLLVREDHLDGLHANTQIPKVIGFARIGELEGNDDWAEAAEYFWERVVHHRSISIGGNSVREHFHSADDFSSMIRSREGPETCNTYNMMRLSERLFRREPVAQYADYYERALFNHILSSQHPGHGGFVYFTSMRPRHYRVYSQPETCFWCCVGSGMENHGKYGQFIYAHQGDTLFVNLFMASTLNWEKKGLKLRQETDFPLEEGTTLVLNLERPHAFTLAIRQPFWVAAGELTVKVNGETAAVGQLPSSYVRLKRTWHPGDRIEVSLPMRARLERLPDGSDYASIDYGPLVLGARINEGDTPGLIADDARMGHIAPGAYLRLDEAPMLVGNAPEIEEAIHPVPGKPLHFTASMAIRPDHYQSLELEPFYQIHDTRYMVYWQTVPTEAYEEVVARLAEKERERLALEARTLDLVHPGEQQTEVEHAFAAEGPQQGAHLGRTWRAAKSWFEYRLDSGGRRAEFLRVTLYAADRGKQFDVMVNGRNIATLQLTGGDPDQFVDREIELPAEIAEASEGGPLTVRFVARENSTAGPIYGLRLLGTE